MNEMERFLKCFASELSSGVPILVIGNFNAIVGALIGPLIPIISIILVIKANRNSVINFFTVVIPSVLATISAELTLNGNTPTTLIQISVGYCLLWCVIDNFGIISHKA